MSTALTIGLFLVALFLVCVLFSLWSSPEKSQPAPARKPAPKRIDPVDDENQWHHCRSMECRNPGKSCECGCAACVYIRSLYRLPAALCPPWLRGMKEAADKAVAEWEAAGRPSFDEWQAEKRRRR